MQMVCVCYYINMDIKNIGNRECAVYDTEDAKILLIQPCDEHDLEGMENEIRLIRENVSVPFTLAAVRIQNWNQELSPWKAPPVFGNEGFGSGGGETLRSITQELIPYMKGMHTYEKIILGGYSLAGFFALWAGYETELFDGIAAVSPSVWFEGWDTYRENHFMKADTVYLSLGDKEEKTRNRTMAKVGDRIRSQYDLLSKQGIRCVLEWNPGNHFKEADLRTAKGFIWLIRDMYRTEVKTFTNGKFQ